MPDGATYNCESNIITGKYIARLEVDSPLEDEAQNHVVWSYTRSPIFA